MEPSEKVAIITGAALATASAVGFAWWYAHWDGRTNARVPLMERIRPVNTQPVTQAQLVEWLGTHGELLPVASKPSNARRVPVVARTWTPFVPREQRTRMNSARDRLSFLNAIRAALQGAGRGSEDPRCVMCLLANESDWDRSGWNCNWGNVKSQGTVYADRTTLLGGSEPFVWTSNQFSQGVYLITDNYRSFDGYHSFADPTVYMRWHGAFLERRHPGIIAGYRQGGLEGLLAAETAVAMGGYAEAPYDGDRLLPNGLRARVSLQSYAVMRRAEGNGYWRACTRLLGENFRK